MIERLHARASGSWRVTTNSELSSIKAAHGDEAYVTDEGRWYKYAESLWQVMTDGATSSSADETYVAADGTVHVASYSGNADLR